MATLRKISGSYYGYFYDRTRTPKRKSYPLQVSLKSAAEKKLKRLEEAWAEGAFDPWQGGWSVTERQHVTVSRAVNAFLEAKASEVRATTLRTYREVCEDLLLPTLPPNLMLRDLSAEHLRPFVLDAALRTASQRKRYRHLRAFFKWSVKEGLLDRSPLEDVQQPREEKRTAAFLSREDAERLLLAIGAHTEMMKRRGKRWADDMWLKDMIRVGLCTGLRRGELLALRWRDVDLEHGFLTVANRGTFKTKSGSERRLPVVGDAFEVLQRRYVARLESEAVADGPVFTDGCGLSIKPDRASRRLKKFLRLAKLDEDLHFHSLRHTCASWLAMRGVPLRTIQAILGHSSITVTERYSHLSPEVMVKAMQETFG